MTPTLSLTHKHDMLIFFQSILTSNIRFCLDQRIRSEKQAPDELFSFLPSFLDNPTIDLEKERKSHEKYRNDWFGQGFGQIPIAQIPEVFRLDLRYALLVYIL